jgi:site-specific DNA-methyltransferase (adenine-specific)/adenine-specific DNA-methyltransferase
MLKEYRGKVDLVYIDPPFDSNADYKKKVSLKNIQVKNDSSVFEEKQYSDIWTNDEYLQFMYERVLVIRELMSDKSTLYLHCDYRKVHYLKIILDSIFGAENFKNEITWRRQIARGMKVYAKHYAFSADYLLIYTKSEKNFVWNRQVLSKTITIEEADKKYLKDSKGYFRTSDPGSYSFESLLDLNKENRLYAPKGGEIVIDFDKRIITSSNGGNVSVKYYRELTKEGVIEEKTVDNIWDDLPGMGIVSSEYIGYPTQKPESLLERVISASSNEGDLVFDCFMGSGTTQVVADRMKRRFIGADINLGAIQTTTNRLIFNQDHNLIKSKTGFEVYNVNNYDFFKNPLEAKELLLSALNVSNYKTEKLFDGELDGRNVKIMPINRIASKVDLNELIANLPYESYRKRQEESPNAPVDQITLICMGHEPDLLSEIKKQTSTYKIDIEILDILTDKKDLEFKREAKANIEIIDGKLIIQSFYPMNLLQKLSIQQENVGDYRQLVESVMIDWNYDGVALRPTVIDIPEKNAFVEGSYILPETTSRIRVKITDLISESLEIEVTNNG